jgi:hypothetical protein
MGSKGKICWSFTKVSGVKDPTSASIHTLYLNPDVAGVSTAYNTTPTPLVSLGARYAASGCAPMPAGVGREILGAATSFYITVEGADFPNQALRMQL